MRIIDHELSLRVQQMRFEIRTWRWPLPGCGPLPVGRLPAHEIFGVLAVKSPERKVTQNSVDGIRMVFYYRGGREVPQKGRQVRQPSRPHSPQQNPSLIAPRKIRNKP